MALDYSALLNASARVPGAFNAGLEAGQERRRREAAQNALTAYSQNPSKESANALFPYDPRLAVALSERAAAEEAERAQRDIIGRLYDGSGGAGAPPGPDTAVPPPPPTQFDQPPQPSQQMPQVQRSDGVQINHAVLAELMTVNPDLAIKLADFASKASKKQLEDAALEGELTGLATVELAQYPPGPEREAARRALVPILVQRSGGTFTAEEILAVDISDEGLRRGRVFGQSLKDLTAQANNVRDFNAAQDYRAATLAQGDRRIGIAEGNLALGRDRFNRGDGAGPSSSYIDDLNY